MPESPRKLLTAPPKANAETDRAPFKLKVTQATANTKQLPDKIRGRDRYPCTICGSTEHLDNFHRGNLAKGPARTGVKVHFADQDKENAPEEGDSGDQFDEHEYHDHDHEIEHQSDEGHEPLNS